jgi:hypothetical protein
MRPLYYEDARTMRQTATARFDWEAKSLTLQFRHGPQQRPMPANAQDRLSFLFSFAFKPPPKALIEFQVVDGKGIAAYAFEVAGRERLSCLPATRGPASGAEMENSATAAGGLADPARSHLPMRVLVVQKDGTRIDQVATRITPP